MLFAGNKRFLIPDSGAFCDDTVDAGHLGVAVPLCVSSVFICVLAAEF